MKNIIQIIELRNPNLFLRKELLKFYNAGFPSSQWKIKKLETFFAKNENGICFIVEKNKKISGLVIGTTSESDKKHLNLSALLIGDDLRGQGYAKKLVTVFVEKAIGNFFFDKIELHFREVNKLKFFYEKLGFADCGIIGIYKNGEQKHSMEISRTEALALYLNEYTNNKTLDK